MNAICKCDEPHYKCKCASLQSSRHNITARLNDNDYGTLARYAVQNGMMFDSAIQQIIAAGLKAVALTQNKESENHHA